MQSEAAALNASVSRLQGGGPPTVAQDEKNWICESFKYGLSALTEVWAAARTVIEGIEVVPDPIVSTGAALV